MNFEQQVVRLIPWMRQISKRYYKDESNSADLVSETVLKILSNKDKYDHKSDLKPWCISIMRNTFLTWHTRDVLVQFVGYESVSKAYVSNVVEYEEIINILRLNYRSLNVKCVCMYAAGYTYDEISRKLDINVGTVRSRIFNGRRFLRKELEIRQ